MQQRGYDIVLFQHDGDDLLDRHAGLRAVGGRVLGQGLTQIGGHADVVDDEPARFVPEGPVDPGDRLHQSRALHRLVDVHRVQRGRVEPGQPHVPDDDDFERVLGVLGASLELLADVTAVQVG